MANVCCTCGKGECSYKCPICREPYCSADCCKKHKTNNCQPPKLQEEESTEEANKDCMKYDFPTEDTIPIEKLTELRDSKEVRDCLTNPHVRNIMRAILTDKNPTKAIALAMTEPIFVEMADACLKVVEPRDTDESY